MLLFNAKYMQLQDIVMSEMCQPQKDGYLFSFTWKATKKTDVNVE